MDARAHDRVQRLSKPTCPKCGSKMTTGPFAPSGKRRWICFGGASGSKQGDYCYSTTQPKASGQRTQSGAAKRPRKLPIFTRALGGVTTILVTAAQNVTPVHKGFVKALESHANHVSAADILVIPYRYKNPTSRWERSQANEEAWDQKEIAPYLFNQRKRLNANLVLMGDVKIQATSGMPLQRMDSMSHAESGIFGHAKLQLKTVPTLPSRPPKILTTTGACTVENYSTTRLGQIAHFHHTMGAALVELRGKKFHLRQINARKTTGEYIDLTMHYRPDQEPQQADRAESLVLGDWHKDFTLRNVERATFGPGGMVPFLQPRRIFWHDVADMYSVNPHHKGNWLVLAAKIKEGRLDARAELERACDYVIAHTPADTESVIVPSNHPEFLSKWILSTDPRTDLANLELWCETAIAMKRSAKITKKGTEHVDAFVYWAKRRFEGHSNIRVLNRGESYMVAGIEHGMHFDKGPNGARGSLKNNSRIGVKVIGGHGHGPGHNEGGTQVGTATGELEYSIGSPSGWLNTHGEVNALGKRCLHNIIGTEWRLQ